MQTYWCADAEAKELITELEASATDSDSDADACRHYKALAAGAQMVKDIFARRFTGKVEFVEEGSDEAGCATTETSSR